MAHPLRMFGFVPSGTFAGYVDSNCATQVFQDGYFVHGLVFIPRHTFAFDSFTNHADSLVTHYHPPIPRNPTLPNHPQPVLTPLDSSRQRVSTHPRQNFIHRGPGGPRRL